MEISASFLSIKKDLKENIKTLVDTNIDYLHLDIMDGIFVKNKTWTYSELKTLLDTRKPLDIHLMVSDVKKYVDDFAKLNPEYITFHAEAVSNVKELIYYIHSKGIKVGLSLKPDTNVDTIFDYLPSVDLILLMSVEPGEGGQKFIESTTKKIEYLKKLQPYNHYKIEVDGGINDETIKYCRKSDIIVVGSFITNGNYQDQVNKLKKDSI